jgi:hypothetical protein
MMLSLTGLLSGLVPFGFAQSLGEKTFRNVTAQPRDRVQVGTRPVFGEEWSGRRLSSLAPARKDHAFETYGRLPLLFEANHGQVNQQVKFISRGRDYNLFLTPSEAVLALRSDKHGSSASEDISSHTDRRSSFGDVLRMKLMGANKHPDMIGMDESSSKINYFIGNDPARWHTDVKTYEKVRYSEVYPGVDVLYYGNQQQLEYDFVLAPGADYRKIILAFEAAKAIRLDARGDLSLRVAGWPEVRQSKPVAYQEVYGQRREVAVNYVLQGKRRVAFRVGKYDRTRPLVIDPVLSYSTYLGGSGSDRAESIAVDSAGSAYVTGATYSLNFPTADAIQGAIAVDPNFPPPGSPPPTDVFVTKLNATGTALVFSTYLGSTGDDLGHGIAVDPSGNVYLTGDTSSIDDPRTPRDERFPMVNAAVPNPSFGRKAFVSKLNPAGSALVYSTYLGGIGGPGSLNVSTDLGNAIAVDSSGNAYVAGQTNATNFPTVNAYQSILASQPENCGFFGCSVTNDAYVVKFDPSGAFIFSTYLGSRSSDEGYGIAVDASRNVYVVGHTSATNFPTTPGAYDVSSGGAFITKISSAGNALAYSSYLGQFQPNAIAVDQSGNAYVVGSAVFNLPTTAGAFDRQCGTDTTNCNEVSGGSRFSDAYVLKLNQGGSALAYATYIGGSRGENATSIAVDSAGNAYVAGSTEAVDFPVLNAIQKSQGGGDCSSFGAPTCADAFVTKLNAAGSALVYSTYLGGNRFEIAGFFVGGNGIAVDSSNNAYVAGSTNSPNFPVTSGAFQTTFGGNCDNALICSDAFIVKIGDPPAYQAATLTPDQTEIKTWTYQGRTYAYVKLLFPNAGYRVANWGSAGRSLNDFTADAAVERFTGASVQSVTTTAQIYDLGPLADGAYNFNFKTSGTLAKTLQFTISSTVPPPNPIDNAREFVKQQYRDFLNREADQAGEDFWTDNITKCADPARRPAGQTEAQCTLRQRETTSGAFFLSPEFQYTGYFVYRMYQGGLGRQPKLSEFLPDAQFVGNGIIVGGQLSGAKINQNKAAFAAQFVNCTDATKYRCAEFKAIYDGLNNQQYVDTLFQTTGVNASASDRAALVSGLNGGSETRASVLQKVVDGINVISEGNQQFTTSYGQAFYDAQFNRAFVQLEYFGYMKRDPDDAGYAFWLAKLNQFGGSFVNAEMVLAFISSPEYRARFGQP